MSERERVRTIRVDELARVEGEGALTLRTKGGRVTSVELRIFEPPRLFEALLVGRGAHEAPDLTARICGICPVAYQMSACQAVERAFGVEVTPEIADLRRLLYCGEWIESHVLHMAMLHAPDFLGVDDAIALAKQAPDAVRAALEIKKTGNAIVALVGGREIHPINPKVGGFHKLPSARAAGDILADVERARALADALATWVGGFRFTALDRDDVEQVALAHPDEYPMCAGRLVSSAGLDVDVDAFEEVIVEEQVAHSTALHARLRDRGPYVTGPLARLAANAARLSPGARETAARIGIAPGCRDPFRSILARAVEVVHALDESARLLAAYRQDFEPSVPAPPREGRGVAITEAPRGILFHRYDVDASGTIRAARIVPPTAQNQRSIELDLEALGPRLASLPHDEARRLAEHAIRNYDPCISCSTHFLRLAIEREP